MILQTTVPNSPAALIFGASNTAWGSFTLPLDLTPFGFTGCRLVASVDLTVSLESLSFFLAQGDPTS